ncbi:hypothetical protein SAMN02745866_00440 [Alteromonadaceae bacterium Bs31]|nr:hypothetical protein SAMN02745866_00440 [Alteromonadaceae bacterium Bs31]
MIKERAIKKFVNDVLAKNLDNLLSEYNYQYVKGKSCFKRKVGVFENIIKLSASRHSVAYDEDNEAFIIAFEITPYISSSSFEKWFVSKTDKKANFRHEADTISGNMLVKTDVFSETDFYIPSISDNFKQMVTDSLSGNECTQSMSIEEIIETLPSIVDKLSKSSDEIVLYNNYQQSKGGSINYLRLLAYKKHFDVISKPYLSIYEKSEAAVRELADSNSSRAASGLRGLAVLTHELKVVANIECQSRYRLDIEQSESMGERLRFCEGLSYAESLRFNTLMVELDACALNDNGDFVVVFNGNQLRKYAQCGELVFTGCIEKLPFLSSIRADSLNEAGDFLINNYLINSDNKLTELKHDFDYKAHKKKSPESKLFTDFAYDEKSSTLFALYSPTKEITLLTEYALSGDIIKTREYKGIGLKINCAHRQLVFCGSGDGVRIVDYDGNQLSSVKTSKSNYRTTLARNGSKIVFHFYGTKSQVYDFESGKQSTIWAHPTYLKNYRENLYGDIHWNFGLRVAKFSPDNKHIIGGAEHGKYVCWEAETLKRIELIPSSESMRYIPKYSSSREIEFEGVRLYVNRGFDILDISFIDNGDYVITHHDNAQLIWDKNQNNIGCAQRFSKNLFSQSKFLLIQEDNQIILMERVFR